MVSRLGAIALVLAACGGSSGGDQGDPGNPAPDALVTYGQPYTGGQFHLGPIDYTSAQRK